MPRVLLVEDDVGISDLLHLALTDGGLQLELATDLASARARLEHQTYDAILLDLNLPDGTGIDLCREIRQTSTVPILILTARRDEIDRVLGLELGADDYILKPFSPREVAARIRATLRRQHWAQERAPQGTSGGVVVDEDRREVSVNGQTISLTRTEFRLVRALAGHPARVFSRAELIEIAWQGAFIQDRVVDSVVSRVRRKLGSTDSGEPRIRTVHGVGYAFADA